MGELYHESKTPVNDEIKASAPGVAPGVGIELKQTKTVKSEGEAGAAVFHSEVVGGRFRAISEGHEIIASWQRNMREKDVAIRKIGRIGAGVRLARPTGGIERERSGHQRAEGGSSATSKKRGRTGVFIDI